MSNIKERIIGAVTIMKQDDAERLWQQIIADFAWADIEEEPADEIDLQMISEANNDSDSKTFISQKDLLEELGLNG